MCAKVGPVGQALGQRDRLALQRIGRDDAVEESPALALLRRHGATGEQQLRRASLADDARQHRAGAHVAAGEADAREEERGLRRRRARGAGPQKSAIIAPAPTQTPSTAAMTGCGQARIALTRSPVMRVKASSPFMSRGQQRTDDLVDVSA